MPLQVPTAFFVQFYFLAVVYMYKINSFFSCLIGQSIKNLSLVFILGFIKMRRSVLLFFFLVKSSHYYFN